MAYALINRIKPSRKAGCEPNRIYRSGVFVMSLNSDFDIRVWLI